MHGWKHWLMGAGFFGFAVFKLMTGGSPMVIALCVVASGYLFYRDFMDQTGAAAEDLQLAVSLVRDPRETLLDLAAANLGGEEEEQPPARTRPGLRDALRAEFGVDQSKAEEAPAFDPDAAIARYLANRPVEQPVAGEPVYRPAVQGFGRKRA